jgi:hypothetical protein
MCWGNRVRVSKHMCEPERVESQVYESERVKCGRSYEAPTSPSQPVSLFLLQLSCPDSTALWLLFSVIIINYPKSSVCLRKSETLTLIGISRIRGLNMEIYGSKYLGIRLLTVSGHSIAQMEIIKYLQSQPN